MAQHLLFVAVSLCVLHAGLGRAQGLTGALIATVKDPQGAVVTGASVVIESAALIGGPISQSTNAKGQFRFLALPPGLYALRVEQPGFKPHVETAITVSSGATIDRPVTLRLEGHEESLVVDGSRSRIEARNPGFGTRFGPEDLEAIPRRRVSMFDPVRAAPGFSPTSPSSPTATTVSAMGSGTNENQFLIDDTNMTCPCNGVARAEVGVDFIQEMQLQPIGASAEYGNLQGAVINVITRQGSERFLSDTGFYAQSAGLTSRPARLVIPNSGQRESSYERARYRDFTTTLGGPAVPKRLWFFLGYQYLRDYDSQPGTEPATPRRYEQNKVFAKLTWHLAPGWQLVQSLHDEHWVNPEQPTIVKPYDATLRQHASVPAITFGHLTHTSSSNRVWDVRVGRFVYTREDDPSTGSLTTANRTDRLTRIASGGPQSFGGLTLIRTTAKAALTQYTPDLLGGDHEWKIGGQIERGEGHGTSVIPTGVRYVDSFGQPFQATSADPALSGGLFITLSGFASDAFTLGDRVTVSAGLRFDRNDAISQDLRAIDAEGREKDRIVEGKGTLYTWDVWSPRLGATVKLTEDGRTLLRGSYGRFNQGLLTGEFSGTHPGATATTTGTFDPATGGYTRNVVVDDPRNALIDPGIRPPHTDAYSLGVDRELRGRLAVAAAYVYKRGRDFIGWTDVGGVYDERPPDGRNLQVFAVRSAADRRFMLTNPDGYSMTYHGLITAVEKRRAHGWQAFGSYTFSRAYGLQASSGAAAAAPQSSSVAIPTVPIGRDPNDLVNARGRLPNDRPHMLRAMGAIDVPRTRLTLAANLQHVSGKPWAASAQVLLPQGDRRILLEPPGSRRLSSQTLLDVRLSRPIRFRGVGFDLLLDVLNLLNDTAEEAISSDSVSSPNFGQPSVFVDPRRAMLGVRLNLGR